MSSPYQARRTGRVKTFTYGGSFTVALKGFVEVHPPTGLTVREYILVDGFASMPGIFDVNFGLYGVGSSRRADGINLGIYFPHTLIAHSDGGAYPYAAYTWDTDVTWSFVVDAEEWIDVGVASAALTALEVTEANYPNTTWRTDWRTKIGGAFALNAHTSDGVLVAVWTGVATDTKPLFYKPNTQSRAAFIIAEDTDPAAWGYFNHSSAHMGTKTIYANLTGSEAPIDVASWAASGATSVYGGSWSASAHNGAGAVVITSPWNARYESLFDPAVDHGGLVLSVAGGPPTVIDVAASLRQVDHDHPAGSSVFTLTRNQGYDLYAHPIIETRSNVGGGLQTFYNYYYGVTGVPVPTSIGSQNTGFFVFTVEPATLAALGGGHLDTRVLMRGQATDALTFTRADHFDFVLSAGWTTLSPTTRRASFGVKDFSGYRFYELQTTSVPAGTTVTIGFGTSTGAAVQTSAVVDSAGLCSFDTLAIAATSGIVDDAESVLTGPGRCTQVIVSGLPTGGVLGTLRGVAHDPASVVMTAMGNKLRIRADGRDLTSIDGLSRGRGSAFLADRNDWVNVGILGCNFAATALNPSLSLGDAYELGGAGAIYDGGWQHTVLQPLPGTIRACELFSHFEPWPGSGDVAYGGTSYGTVPVRVCKILGMMIEGTVSQPRPVNDSGFEVTATSADATWTGVTTGALGDYRFTCPVLASGSVVPEPFHFVDVSLTGYSLTASELYQNRGLARVMFCTSRKSKGKTVANSHNHLGQFIRVSQSSSGLILKIGRALASALSTPSTITTDTADTSPALFVPDHLHCPVYLSYVENSSGSAILRSSLDDAQTFNTEMATIPNCSQSCVLVTSAGWTVLAGFQPSVSSVTNGSILLSVKGPGDSAFSAPYAIADSTGPISFADNGFDLAASATTGQEAILSATATGSFDISEWYSLDDFKTWRLSV